MANGGRDRRPEGQKAGRKDGQKDGHLEIPCVLQDIGIFLQCFTISLIDEPTVGQINHWKNQQTSQETKPLADIQECI